jgi:cytochrome c556
MMTGTGQFGPIEMGGRFTVLKAGSAVIRCGGSRAVRHLRRRHCPRIMSTITKGMVMRSKPARLALLVLLAPATLALAHEGATGVVKERMDLMKRQQKDMKVIGDMAKGSKPFDAAKAAESARDISVTARKIHELFPEGSADRHSEALDTIWIEWDRFAANADELESVANALAVTLEGTDQNWKSAFQKVTDVCKSCHQDFRVKKKEKGLD